MGPLANKSSLHSWSKNSSHPARNRTHCGFPQRQLPSPPGVHLTDRGGLSSVPEAGRTLPFPFSHGPRLPLPPHTYIWSLPLSLIVSSQFLPLSENPLLLTVPRPPPSPTACSISFTYNALSAPQSLPPLSLPLFSGDSHINRKWLREKEKEGVCAGKPLLRWNISLSLKSGLVCVLDTSGWNPGPSSWNSPTTVSKTAGTQFRA